MRSIIRRDGCRPFRSLPWRRRANLDPSPPSLAPAGGRRRLWRVPLAVFVTLGVLANGLALTAGVAAADSGSSYPPPDLFNMSALELPATLPSSGDYYAGGVYSATPAQITSLQDLEQQAVANTISDHALAATDTEAVESWARSDADAELWALLVQAIQAVQAGTATTDQQNAAAWLGSVVQRQGVLSAQAAGLEYTKWAGLGIAAYQDLIASKPSESALQSFLSVTPEPYTDGGSDSDPSASADGGYCVYQSPSPYQSDYTANIYDGGAGTPETCFTPCTALFGCPPVTPTYDQFTEWGAADVNEQLFNNAAFATDIDSIAVSGSLDGLATVGSVAAGLGTGFALGTSGTLAGSPFQTSVFPYANRPYVQTSANKPQSTETAEEEDTADVADAEEAGEDTAEAVETAAEGALDAVDATAGAVAASGVGIIVAAVIFAITTAVQEGLSVFSAADLPGQLAQYIANAPTATYNLGSDLSNSSEAQGLYSLFVGATEPDPTFTSCNNNPGGLVIGSLDATPAATAPCLNPTPVPAQESYDPQWAVTPQGSATSTTEPTISLTDAASQQTSTIYLDGNWFVSTGTVNGTSASVQSLRLQYTDWNSNEDTAWLFDNASPPEFLVVNDGDLGSSFDPSTCLASGTCWLTQSIDYVGGDGNNYSASVTPGGAEAPPVPASPTSPSNLCSNDGNALGCVTPSPTSTTVAASPAEPGINQPVTLTASLDAPIWATGTVDFTEGSTELCSDVPLQQVDTVTDLPGGIEEISIGMAATCTTSFATEGAQYVFATYSGDIQGDEPSQGELTLDVSNQAATSTSVTAGTPAPVVGQPADYTATVSDYPGGPAPGGTVTFTSGSATLCSGAPVSADGTAVCTWAFPATGNETVTATYSGDANTTGSSGQTSVSVGPAPTTTQLQLVSPSNFPGQVFTYQATVMPQTPAGPAPTGTVTFTNGSTTVCSGVALSTTAPFTATCAPTYDAAGDETLTATYSGDTNYVGSSAERTVNVIPAESGTSLAASTSAPVVGQPVTYIATVSSNAPGDSNPPAPTGTVTFTNGATTVCSGVALSPNGTATCTQTYDGPGPEMMTADYSGDDATLASMGQAGVSVSKASSSTSVVASVAAPVVGQPVTYTAAVSVSAPDSGGPAPTGTVTFTNGAATLCSGLVLTATASATCAQTYATPGVQTVTATYSGDRATLSSSGQAAVAVAQASTTTSLTATATAVVGQPVTYTASVVLDAPDTAGPAPTGAVNFSNGTATVCANVPLSSNGTASCTQSYRLPGAEVLTANYSGDRANLGSSAQATIEVSPASTTTSLSASTTNPVVGQTVTYTATVTVEASDTNGPAPTGTVSFAGGSTTICPDVPLSSSGTASCSETYMSTGPETLTATYSGDGANLGSSDPGAVTVGQAATSTSLSASPASASFGQAVTLTAQVSPAAPSTAGPVPSGTVSFALDGRPVADPVSLTGGQAVSQPITNLAPGTHQVSATYSGDANYSGSEGSLSETVTCSQTITTGTSGPLTVSNSTCVEGGSLSGPVTISSGGALALVGASVKGPITGMGAASVLMCGTSVKGPVTLTDSTGPVELGGAPASPCAPDKFNGPLTVFGSRSATSVDDSTFVGPLGLTSNTGPVSLAGDNISGPVDVSSDTAGVTVTDNTVTGPLSVMYDNGATVVNSNSVSGVAVVSGNSSSSAATVSGNTVGGALDCSGNTPAPSDAGTANQVAGGGEGQCTGLV